MCAASLYTSVQAQRRRSEAARTRPDEGRTAFDARRQNRDYRLRKKYACGNVIFVPQALIESFPARMHLLSYQAQEARSPDRFATRENRRVAATFPRD